MLELAVWRFERRFGDVFCFAWEGFLFVGGSLENAGFCEECERCVNKCSLTC